MERPRLIATDLDGTLLRSDGTLSDRTAKVLVEIEEAGIEVVFVTARPPRWLDALADAVAGHGTVICGNGAFVYDVGARTVLAANGSGDKEIARQINVSVATIRTYWDRVKVKLGARNRTHAVVVAIVAGFLIVVAV